MIVAVLHSDSNVEVETIRSVEYEEDNEEDLYTIDNA